MTEQMPEVVAAVDVSPVSPKPIHTSATSPALVPSLQDHAATLNVAYLDSLTTAPFPFVTMPVTSTPSANPTNPAANSGQAPEPSTAPDPIVAQGDANSHGTQDEDDAFDDERLDAYGEDDGEPQDDAEVPQSSHVQQEQHVADSRTGPVDGTEAEIPVAEPDVTEASSESMINTPSATSSPDSNVVMKSESPAAVPSHAADPVGAIPSTSMPADTPDTNGQAKAESQTIVDSSAATSDATAAAAANAPAVEHEEDSLVVDIQKLVNDISAANVAASSTAATATSQTPAEATSAPLKQATPSISLPQSSSLPPKPVISQQAGQPGSRPEDFHPFQSRGSNNSHGPPPMPMQGVVHSQAAPTAPGTTAGSVSSLPPIPPTSIHSGAQHYASLPNVMSAPGSGAVQREGLQGAQLEQAWEAFQEDEQRYLTEAKWERFPENSRIFIGNLSSERVSKREVFDVFHRFGRLAQISLKSAFGFVQYHLSDDAEAAMQTAQGAELGGRKIHLEFSRVQKKKDPQERDQRGRSPNLRNQRSGGGSASGQLDRYDGRDRDQGRRRDGYRPGRSPPPRRDSYERGGRDNYRGGTYDRNPRHRSRSRSPRPGRYGQDPYRRRSRSPRKRGPPEPSPDIPQRYGEQVPDVQLLLTQEVGQDFVSWVQRAFFARGLKADVMYFNPRFSRDTVLQKLVVEGVHGVIELDTRAQTVGKIPLQVFDRSAGSNVRFDQYQDLDPTIAAELVLQTKQRHAAPPQPQQPAYPAYPQNPYTQCPPQAYAPQQAHPQAPPTPAGYPYTQAPPAAAPPPAAPALSIQDVAGLAGKIDNNTLQALLASLSGGQQAAQPGVPPAAPQVDISALLSSMQGGGAPAHQPPAPAYGVPGGYMPHMGGTPVPPQPAQAGAGGGDAAKHVQNIMDILARQR